MTTETKLRGSTGEYKCHCGNLFTARVSDRKRGWARFCSKSCKAVRQEQRTGQHHAFVNRYEGGMCFPSPAEGEIQ